MGAVRTTATFRVGQIVVRVMLSQQEIHARLYNFSGTDHLCLCAFTLRGISPRNQLGSLLVICTVMEERFCIQQKTLLSTQECNLRCNL